MSVLLIKNADNDAVVAEGLMRLGYFPVKTAADVSAFSMPGFPVFITF